MNTKVQSRLLIPISIALFTLVLLITMLWAMPTSASRIVYYSDETVAAGINTNHSAASGIFYMLVGQAWGDYDSDGYPDLYVTNQNNYNTLYHNDGDGTFSVSPLSASVAMTTSQDGGVIFADYDNDGDQDLYVASNGANTLYRNDGGTAFVDVTAAAGVGDTGKGSSASWGDFDSDGLIDLYVANWRSNDCTDPDPNLPCVFDRDRLYHNNGDGTFTDYSHTLGFANIEGLGFIASYLDYDNDGDLDIYLVNDMYRNPIGNKMFRNDGPQPGGNNAGGPAVACEDTVDWCFTEVSTAIGADQNPCGMGLAVGDYDNDKDLDMYFSNAAACGAGGIHIFLENQTSQGNPVFTDVTASTGTGSDLVGWGTLFTDVNYDGWEDLYLAQSGPFNAGSGVWPYNRLYLNNQDSTVTNLANTGVGGDYAGPSWGVASADYDRDGWVDLVVSNRNGSSHQPDFAGHKLYRNTASNPSNRWIALTMIGNPTFNVNLDAVGARVTITDTNGTVHMKEVKAGHSLGGGSELTLYFGFGSAKPHTATVRWPDGTTASSGALRPTNTRFSWVYGFPDPILEAATPTAVALQDTNVGGQQNQIELPLLFTLLLMLSIITIAYVRRTTLIKKTM